MSMIYSYIFLYLNWVEDFALCFFLNKLFKALDICLIVLVPINKN